MAYSDLDYIGIKTLKITKNSNLDKVKDILFSLNNLENIEFLSPINIKVIDIVKCLLESSPFIEDKNIKKYIIVKNKWAIKNCLKLKFNTPSTWYISYYNKDNLYKIDSVSNLRNINSKTNYLKYKSRNLSNLEKVTLAYSLSLKVDRNNSIKTFNYLLNKLDIVFINLGANFNNSSLVKVEDNKYNINSAFIFNPIYSDIFLLSPEEYFLKLYSN